MRDPSVRSLDEAGRRLSELSLEHLSSREKMQDLMQGLKAIHDASIHRNEFDSPFSFFFTHLACLAKELVEDCDPVLFGQAQGEARDAIVHSHAMRQIERVSTSFQWSLILGIGKPRVAPEVLREAQSMLTTTTLEERLSTLDDSKLGWNAIMEEAFIGAIAEHCGIENCTDKSLLRLHSINLGFIAPNVLLTIAGAAGG